MEAKESSEGKFKRREDLGDPVGCRKYLVFILRAIVGFLTEQAGTRVQVELMEF